MTHAAATDRVRTRPTPRITLIVLLIVLVYGAGANVGAGIVLFLAAGMAVGSGWSVARFLRHVGELRVWSDRAVVLDEGRSPLVVTVLVPRGVIGVLRTAALLTDDAARALLDVLGQGVSDSVAAQRWVTLPRSGSAAQLRLPTVAARGDGQQLQLELELSDVFGLVRRRWSLTGPVTHVVPASGIPAAFDAASVEGEVDDAVARTLAANGAPGTELRPWRPGEPVRAVHWAASERADQLLMRPRAPETRQRRTLTVDDRAWTRAELDARCRHLVATAQHLAQAGVEVEVSAGGRVVAWSNEARLLLASLPPNASTRTPSEAPPGGGR